MLESEKPPAAALTQAQRRDKARAAILDATVALIAELGLAGFTMANVAERAGYTHGLPGHYYRSKDQLVDAAVAEILCWPVAQNQSEKDGKLAGQKPGLHALLESARWSLTAELDDPVKARAKLVVMTDVHASSRFGSLIADYYRRRSATITRHLEAGCDVGDIRPLDGEAFAWAVQGMQRGVLLVALCSPQYFERSRLVDAYIDALQHALMAYQRTDHPGLRQKPSVN